MSLRNIGAGSVPAPVTTAERKLAASKFYTINDVADLLSVSPRTVRRWIDQRKMVVHRVGAVVRIAESDLKAFIAEHRQD